MLYIKYSNLISQKIAATRPVTRQFCQNSCVSDCEDEPTFAGVKAGIYIQCIATLYYMH